MTWRGMCTSGVGIGMGDIRVVLRQIAVVPHQAQIVCLGAAVGTAARSTAGRRTATTTPRPSGSTATVSVPFCPQVSELNNESGACAKKGNVCAWEKRSPRSGRLSAPGGQSTPKRTRISARAQDRILRAQYPTKVERKCKVGDATGGRRDRWETPRASFIPAQGNALGSPAQNPISAESAIHPSSYQPPA
jgi:hypothetical protein